MSDLPLKPGAVPGLIYSVSELNREVRGLLESHYPLVWVQGEISNIARPASGHIYFSLKDATAQIRCAMFRGRALRLKFRPGDGQEVLVKASLGLYEARGDYQLIVEAMEPAGEGALKLKFEELKAKLDREGLFAAEKKRPLPPYPQRLGVITSPTGAAIRDILSVLKRRSSGTEVVIYPCQVQGAAAAPSIVAALEQAGARAECDLLIVARGGGSLEDLWPFNEESVARAIAASPLPVVSGVGHEVDVTIADLVADVRAPTPSAAAELTTRHAEALASRLDHLAQRLMLSMDRFFAERRQRVEALARSVGDPRAMLSAQTARLAVLKDRLAGAMRFALRDAGLELGALHHRLAPLNPKRAIAEQRTRFRDLERQLTRAAAADLKARRLKLAAAEARLKAYSPEATLERGYAIVFQGPDRRIVRRTGDVAAGEGLAVRVADGEFGVTVDPDDA